VARHERNRRELTVDDVTVVESTVLKRAVGAAALGNAMEWFDFGVYAYLATTISSVFFPASDGGAALLATLGAFTAAFLVRPLGGLFFGPLGDRIGRKRVLSLTMLLMAAGTLAIGFIPSYQAIGIASPILLLAARLLQGFSTGGEYGGATTFIAEYSPDKRRGFMGSWLEFGTLAGYVLGAGLVTILNAAMPQEQLLAWGWRIPFLVAGPLGVIGLYMRLRLEETPAFQRQQQNAAQREREKVPFATLFVRSWRALLVCVGLVLVFNVCDYMLLTYMPTYLTDTFGRSPTHGLLLIIVVMILMMCVITFGGRLSDVFGRKPVLLGGCIGFLVLSWPSLKLVQSSSVALSFLGLLILGLVLVTFTSTMPSTLPALFPTAIRYGALAISFNVSVSLFGGTTPLATQALVEWASDAHWPLAADIPAFYLMAAAVIGMIAVLAMSETANLPLRGSPPAVSTPEEAHAVIRDIHDPESAIGRSAWGRGYRARLHGGGARERGARDTHGQHREGDDAGER
jgi:MHS family proline/betaine transporter-like MFS transporter